MFESFANWFLNTFIRLSPTMEYIVCPMIVIVMLIALAKGFKQSKCDYKSWKNFGYGPFIIAVASFVYLSLVTFIG